MIFSLNTRLLVITDIFKYSLLLTILTFLSSMPLRAEEYDFFSLNVLHQQLLTDDNEKRVAAFNQLKSLARSEKKEMVLLLETNLQDPKEDVRLRSLIALEKIKTKQSKKIIKEHRMAHKKHGLKLKLFSFEGTDPTIKRQDGSFVCYEYENIFVTTWPAENGGETIVVMKKKKKLKLDCRGAVEQHDFFVKNSWAQHFLGAYYPLIFVQNTSATGTDWMTLYNVRNRKKLYATEYTEPIRIREEHFEYWITDGGATGDNCDIYNDYLGKDVTLKIKRLVKLRFEDLRLEKTEKTRCIPEL